MSLYTLQLIRYLVGLRGPETTVTTQERAALRRLAKGCYCVVEIGVYEGATSAVLCEALGSGGMAFLIDPYRDRTRFEAWLGFSGAAFVAQRTTRPWREQARFVRATSLEAARELVLPRSADLVFIDADHSYGAVLADFEAWSTRLAQDGVIALHDSRPCPARPELDAATGPVRLALEIEQGQHGSWELVTEADSLTAYRALRSS